MNGKQLLCKVLQELDDKVRLSEAKGEKHNKDLEYISKNKLNYEITINSGFKLIKEVERAKQDKVDNDNKAQKDKSLTRNKTPLKGLNATNSNINNKSVKSNQNSLSKGKTLKNDNLNKSLTKNNLKATSTSYSNSNSNKMINVKQVSSSKLVKKQPLRTTTPGKIKEKTDSKLVTSHSSLHETPITKTKDRINSIVPPLDLITYKKSKYNLSSISTYNKELIFKFLSMNEQDKLISLSKCFRTSVVDIYKKNKKEEIMNKLHAYKRKKEEMQEVSLLCLN